MRWMVGLLAACVVLAAGMGNAQTPAPKFALVIGVGDYGRDAAAQRAGNFVTPPPLANAVSDAGLVADALVSKGFTVTRVTNPDRRTMLAAINTFAQALTAAGPEAVSVFYFAGHGAQGRPALERDIDNYLVPLGTSLTNEIDLESEALGLSRISEKLRPGPRGATVIILDACRDFALPQSTKSVATRGLAESRAAPGTMIAYATSPGAESVDALPGQVNGPYAQALAAEVREAQGATLEQIFIDVRNKVLEQTRNRQLPWENSSLRRTVTLGVAPASTEPEELQRLRVALVAANAELQARTAGEAERARPEASAGRTRSVAKAGAYDVADDGGTLLLQALQHGHSMADIQRASQDGNAEALYLVGIAKMQGIGGVAVDAPGARALLRQATLKGFARAAYAYGGMLWDGEGGPKNEEEALNWWQAGAEANYPPALFRLGDYYAYSAPQTERSFDRALPFYQRAAAAGHERARVVLADYDWYGQGRPKNVAAALAAYQRLAAGGNQIAMQRLGDAYRYGTNVPKDTTRARDLYLQAARAGNAEAAGILGIWLADGYEGASPDLIGALPLLQQAVRARHYPSRARLAKLLVNGDVPSQPGTDPTVLAMDADAHGYPEGLGALATNLREGKNGVTRDWKRAAELARISYANNSSRPMSEEGAWPLYLKGAAYTIQVALAEHALAPLSDHELSDLNRRWGKVGSPLLKFSVPVDFEGTKSPFDVFVWDAPDNDAPPTDAQFDWIEQARGGHVPSDVRESFRKLFKIAKDNNVSFSMLAEYALGAARGAPPPPSPEQKTASDEKIIQARALVGQHQIAAAIDAVTAAIALTPGAAVYKLRATLYETSGDYARAIADYDAASVLASDDAEAQNGRCWLRAVTNRELDKANTACANAIALSPTNGDYFDSYGLVMFRMGRFHEAFDAYDKALEKDAHRASYLYGRGVAASRIGDTARSNADISAATAADADIAQTYARMGVVP